MYIYMSSNKEGKLMKSGNVMVKPTGKIALRLNKTSGLNLRKFSNKSIY